MAASGEEFLLGTCFERDGSDYDENAVGMSGIVTVDDVYAAGGGKPVRLVKGVIELTKAGKAQNDPANTAEFCATLLHKNTLPPHVTGIFIRKIR